MCAVPAGSTTAAGESPAPRSIAGAAAAGGAPASSKASATLPAHLRITRSLLGDGRGRLQRALDLRPEVHRARELGLRRQAEDRRRGLPLVAVGGAGLQRDPLGPRAVL